MRPPGIHALRYSYKLSADYTNNEAEYEAMILAILALNKLQVRRVVLWGYFKLVIKKMTNEYQVRNPQIRIYQNAAQDLIEGFEEYSFKLIPRV